MKATNKGKYDRWIKDLNPVDRSGGKCCSGKDNGKYMMYQLNDLFLEMNEVVLASQWVAYVVDSAEREFDLCDLVRCLAVVADRLHGRGNEDVKRKYRRRAAKIERK